MEPKKQKICSPFLPISLKMSENVSKDWQTTALGRLLYMWSEFDISMYTVYEW